MAENKMISQFEEKTTVTGAEMLAVADSGTNMKVSINTVKDFSQPDLSGYAKTEDIPTVPANVSELTNDAGYITSSALSGYAQTSDVMLKIT